MPSVSAIIVSFNSGGCLPACVAAIRENVAGLAWEAVIVDNASADESAAIAERLGEDTQVIRNRENVGFARAVNQALARSRHELVLLVNPDSTIGPGAVSALVRELDRHPECALAAPRVLESDGRVQGSARGDPDMLTGLFGRQSRLRRLFPRARASRRNVRAGEDSDGGSIEVDWVSGACMLVRRSDLVAVGGFDERYFLYWEDADLCRRLRGRGRTIRYVPEASLIHLTGWSSEAARSASVRAFHDSAYLYYSTHVAPGRLDPARLLAWVLLRLRCWWKLAAARVNPGSDPT